MTSFALRMFDRNLPATGCLSLSLPVPLRELKPDKHAVLSPPVPPYLPLSVKENDSGSVSLGSNPSPAAPQNMLFCRENAEVTKPLENYLAPFDRDI